MSKKNQIGGVIKMQSIINCYATDRKNIGDSLSSPLNYFELPGAKIEKLDIRLPVKAEELEGKHIIIGGGGLLFPRFLPEITTIINARKRKKLIAWGIGQQIYVRKKGKLFPRYITDEAINSFDYSYLENFDLVGIRDFGILGYDWLPCASCMHKSFDKKREIKHEFVVFSHKKFLLNIENFPRLTNECNDMEKVLDFLGSGETVLTSSYHGVYWATLLGRKVLAFPFSSKFYTLKHKPNMYPVELWLRKKKSFIERLNFRYKNKFYFPSTNSWQSLLKDSQSYPESLEECRHKNQLYYSKVMEFMEI